MLAMEALRQVYTRQPAAGEVFASPDIILREGRSILKIFDDRLVDAVHLDFQIHFVIERDDARVRDGNSFRSNSRRCRRRPTRQGSRSRAVIGRLVP
jgi:hypothetical protein